MRHGRRFTKLGKGNPAVAERSVDRSGSSRYPNRDGFSTATMKRCVSLLGLVGLTSLTVFTQGCAHEFDTDRQLPKRGSVGEEIYGVLCDRVGAQALREDLSGASFKNVCHRNQAGDFADTVDESKLPSLDPNAVNEKGEPVSIEKQREDRKRAIGKIEALARRRADLVRALDATFPEEKVPRKDLDNPDPTKSCDVPKKNGEALLTEQLADLLGRTADLYNDGTIPNSTRSLATVMEAFKKSPEAQAAWSRLSARQGYRPIETALGAARPVIAYPNLRNFANASLRLLAADSQPYELEPKYDAEGNRIPVPGPGNAALNKLLEAAHGELLATKIEPMPAPLSVRVDAATGRQIVSRPRDNLEMLQEILFTSDEAFGGGAPKYIVKRDPRGYARISGGLVPAPFVDENQDGLPDVDELGRFKTANNSLAPSPFPIPGEDGAPRDPFGRVLAGDQLLYEYIDTSHTFAAQLMADMKPLVNPNPEEQHETLMDFMGGLAIAMGPRAPMSKQYPSGTVEYEGIKDSPVVDLVYALGTILGDRSADTTLQMVRNLTANKPREIARLTGALSAAFDIAQKHPEAKIPRTATFWDENMDIVVEIAREPGLLEDVLRALADPATSQLGAVFARFAAYRDDITYDRNDLNGGPLNATRGNKGEPNTPVDRDKPYVGENRSIMYRFFKMVSDSRGVTACNKEGAKVHALGISLPLSFRECEVFKIENLDQFYLDAIANAQELPSRQNDTPRPGTIYMRPSLLRVTPGVVDILEDSSGLVGFWPASGNVVAPQPKWLNRLVFFDHKGDTQNAKTKEWIYDLQGEFMGSSVCPERVIGDPSPDAADARPDGMIRGLRNCPNGQWLQQRNPNALFALEHFGFYDAIRPLIRAFAAHKREDLFSALAAATYKHWPDKDATSDDCKLPGGVACPRTGMNSYEGLIAEAFATDVLPALQVLAKELEVLPVTKCTAYDAQQNCTAQTTVTGIEVVAEATRAAVDPDYAKNVLQLKDRKGNVTAKRNDGTTNPQVTPAYLITQALAGIDEAFDKYEEQHPEDQGKRREGWRRARSQMVDAFLGVQGVGSNAQFKSPAMPKMGPVLVDMLRAQLHAHCPRSFAPPYERCNWARDVLWQHAEETISGPLMASALGVMDAIQSDPESRRETNLLMTYLLDEGSKNDALASLLASANDMIQILRDDENLVPLFHVLAAAVDGTKRDENGKVISTSLVDAQTALLAKLSGRYFDQDGKEICSKEIDPNQVLAVALGHLVTPINDGDFKGQTPLEVIIDVIADVNRVDPTLPYEGTLAKDDYEFVAENVVDFLTNKERGLEQFYEVIRNGTRF